jgi:hypothetical protein
MVADTVLTLHLGLCCLLQNGERRSRINIHILGQP